MDMNIIDKREAQAEKEVKKAQDKFQRRFADFCLAYAKEKK